MKTQYNKRKGGYSAELASNILDRSLDQPMFTIDSSKGLQICGESTPLVDIKKLITPIPRIEPFSVGDGIIIEGTTVPYSEILIKNKGIEYKGQADDKCNN